jgi:hypothetical protein
VERLLNRYLNELGGTITTQSQKANFEKAYNLYAEGRYGEAFAAISQAISQLLPADFMVAGHGQLGEYPVHIQVDNNSKVHVTLKEVSDTAVRFSMDASSDATVQVSLLTDSGSWSLQQQENGDWLITSGDTPAAEGKVTFTVNVKERISKQIPLEFEARCNNANATNIVLTSQDPRVNDYCVSTSVAVSSSVQVWRGADGTPKDQMQAVDISRLKAGDYLQVKLNERGMVVEIYAWYGQITGTVIKVEEISLEGEMSNAFVTIQADDGTTKRLEIGYDCKLNFTGATGENGKMALVESVGLTVGQKVSATYCPYTVNDRTRAIEITD